MRSMRALAFLTFLSLAACGSVHNKLPDAGDDVDAVDQPDARTTGTITVTVVTDYGDVDSNGNQLPVGVPRQGAQVYFIEASGDSHLVTTGGDGVAISPEVHANTVALVLRPQTTTQYGLEVFFALDPGMAITAGPAVYSYVNQSQLSATPMTVNAPASAFGVANWGYQFPCYWGLTATGTPPQYTMTLADPCVRTGRTLVSFGYDTNYNLVAYSSRVTDESPGITVNMPAFQQAQTFVANISNLPSSVSQMGMNGNYMEMQDYVSGFGLNGTVTGGAAVLQSPTAPLGERLEMNSYFYPTTCPTGCAQNRHFEVVTGAPTSIALDGADMLPFISYPQFDPATRSINWDETGSTNTGDMMLASGNYHLAAGDIYVSFNLYAPHVGHALTLPDFPTDIRQLMPQPTDTGYVYNALLIDDVASPDYASVIPTADADSRNATYGRYGTSVETWVSGGSID